MKATDHDQEDVPVEVAGLPGGGEHQLQGRLGIVFGRVFVQLHTVLELELLVQAPFLFIRYFS